ncbi:MAG: glycosyltransferase family 2 protein [Acholeplasmatales bacterium]|nr:glycosyltransferase family 2 protein [Acholeplasmatales bacterium]
MIVSLCIVAKDEQKHLPNLIKSINDQDFDKKNIEVVFSIAPSKDNTYQIATDFKESYQDKYYSIKILENEKVRQAPGLNKAIKAATGDLIIRVDAHSVLPTNFVKYNVRGIEEGESIVGGRQKAVCENDSIWSKFLYQIDSSSFGGGIAAFRKETTEKKYVNSLVNGGYKREVFEKIGYFNEKLIRSEDNEFCYRARTNGYKIAYYEDIYSDYYVRSTLRGLLKQKYGNGLWVLYTSKIMTPKIFSLYHFIPFLFTLAVIFTALFPLILLTGIPTIFGFLPMIAFYGAYFLFLLVNIIGEIIKTKNFLMIFSFPFYFLIHLVYGIGSIVGLFKRK